MWKEIMIWCLFDMFSDIVIEFENKVDKDKILEYFDKFNFYWCKLQNLQNVHHSDELSAMGANLQNAKRKFNCEFNMAVRKYGVW